MMNTDCLNLELKLKTDTSEAMERVDAWFNHKILNRPPIRFSAHNSDFSESHAMNGRSWPDLKSRWFDIEYQVDYFLASLKGAQFNAETFPVFWPNLGPEVYSAFYGSELIYKEVTSYSKPLIKDWNDISKIRLNTDNEYYQTILKMTRQAIEKCMDLAFVGYTDLHPGMDCVAAWRDPQQLCIDLLLEPEKVKELIALSVQDFQMMYDDFDSLLKKHGQPSVTWMGVPSQGKMHIPSCDFSSMISSEQFAEFCLPILKEEVKPMTYNVYHVDGPGVARHIDMILSVPEINAIQWVQGMGDLLPVMQWVPFIKKIQKSGKGVIVDLAPSELEDFIAAVEPEGIFLCIDAPLKIQQDIIRRVGKW